MDERPSREPERPEPSWLDEISFATKFTVVVTLLSIFGFALVKIVEMFL
jgi:hypothetical protein